MRAIWMSGSVVLTSCIVALGACTVGSEEGTLGDGVAALDETAPPATDDGDLGGDFGGEQGDPDSTPTDPDDHGGGDPDFDFPEGDVPLELPGGGIPIDFPHEQPDDDCFPVPENCHNGLDDDCDGLYDGNDDDCEEEEECVWGTTNCSSVELIGHCNTHLGDDIDACYAAGNAGNCDPDELYAWCSRRVFDGPGGPWYDYIHDWVDARCDGTVHFEIINGDDYYWCDDADSCERYECKTPLVLVFDERRRVSLVADDGLSAFDLSAEGDGSATRTDWPTADTPWLALDRDGDGRISSGAELFGSATPMQSGVAENGFAPLATLDADGNGLLDACDPAFEQLRLWADTNHDRISQPDELHSLADYGVEALELDYRVRELCDARGNCERERSRFTWRAVDGQLRQGAVVDIHLAVRDAR